MSTVPRETMLKISGLITTPNEYGVYPEGSCARVTNMLSRSANQWEQARNHVLQAQSGTTGDVPYRIVGMDPGVFLGIYVDSATYTTWDLRVNGFTSLLLTYPMSATDMFWSDGHLTPLVTRGRLFLNTKKGVIVLDNLDPQAYPGDYKLRLAGLVTPPSVDIALQTGGAALPNNVTATYALVLRRRYADGYLMLSGDSTHFAVQNTNYVNPVDVQFHVIWPNTNDLHEGDVLELYRSAGISDAGVVDPGSSMRLVARHELDANNVSLGFAYITDRRPMTSPLYETSGEEIYTSPYAEGSTSSNREPPICKAMAQWGDYTFFANIVDPASWVMDVPGGFIQTPNPDAGTDFARTYGIGERRFTCSYTSGSATVTGISASEILGIVPGQKWWVESSPAFPSGTTVVSVGASSITMSANAILTGASVTGAVYDVLEINATAYSMTTLAEFMRFVGFEGDDVQAFPSENVHFNRSIYEYTVGVTVLITSSRNRTTDSFTVRGTNGQNYSPPIPEIDETAQTFSAAPRPNAFRWSKQNQPEAVPTANEGFAGAGDIIRMLPTTDQLWFLCTDGLRRLTGRAGQWQLDMVDPSYIPVAPDAACVMFDTLYAYTSRGVVAMRGIEPTPLTRGVIDDIFPGTPFSASRLQHMAANEAFEEIVFVAQDASDANSATMYVYSTLYRQWSSVTLSPMTLKAIGAMRPSSGAAPYLLFGTGTGANTPAIYRWDGTGPLRNAEMQLQPVYAGDPMLVKQHVDVTWIVNTGSFNTYCQGYFNGVTVYAGGGFPIYDNRTHDARLTFGVPRNVAMGTSVKPSLTIGSGSNLAVVKGVSLRIVPQTNQPGLRS